MPHAQAPAPAGRFTVYRAYPGARKLHKHNERRGCMHGEERKEPGFSPLRGGAWGAGATKAHRAQRGRRRIACRDQIDGSPREASMARIS